MKTKLLLLCVVMFALAGCGSTRSGVRSGIIIPGVRGHTIEQSYALLRSKGFRVSVSAPFTLNGYVPDRTLKAIPPAGTRAPRGSVVTLVPGSGASASPVGVLHPRHYRLPDFTGRSSALARRWRYRHPGFLSMRFSRLDGSTAPSLFAAYVVEAQRPAADRGLSEDGWLDLTLIPRR